MRAGVAAIVAVTVVRLFVAFHFPLIGDETYYWSWSRHLALGYVDHPPMVAWLIALGAPLGDAPGAVRLPSILCEALAAYAAGRAAFALSASARAADYAAIGMLLMPELRLAVGEALPDAPYLCGWTLSLWAAAALARSATRAKATALGLALGLAVLSRFFGWALVFGVAVAAVRGGDARVRRGLALALGIALLLYAPFALWNAQHGWANFTFTAHGRQAFSLHVVSSSPVSVVRLLLELALFCGVAYAVSVRRPLPLVAWTALPLPLAFALISPVYQIEPYWLLGPLASLCVGCGVALATRPTRWLAALGALYAVAGIANLTSAALEALPEGAQARIAANVPALRDALAPGAHAFGPLARDVAALAARDGAAIATDRLEIAGELYARGLRPAMLGTLVQAPMWNGWDDIRDVTRTASAYEIVTLQPPDKMPRLHAYLHARCASLAPSRVLSYRYADQPAASFAATLCRGADDALTANAPPPRTRER